MDYQNQEDDTALFLRANELTENLYKSMGFLANSRGCVRIPLGHWSNFLLHHARFVDMLWKGEIK